MPGTGLYSVKAAPTKRDDTQSGAGITNRQIHSEDFGQSSWDKTLATVESDAASAPNGTSTADKLVESGGTGLHYVKDYSAHVNGAAHTVSVYARAGERTWIWLYGDQTVSNAVAWFDLSNGVVGTVSGASSPSADIEDIGGGWYRCKLSYTVSRPTGIQYTGVGLGTSDGVGTYAGDGASGAYVWGFQSQQTASATGYVYSGASSGYGVELVTGDLGWALVFKGGYVENVTRSISYGRTRARRPSRPASTYGSSPAPTTRMSLRIPHLTLTR